MKTKMNKNNPNKCSGGGGNFSCRHPKLWEYIKSNIKAFFITGVIVFTISASATTVRILHSRQVRYKNDKSVETAINELYEKAGELYGYHVGDTVTVDGTSYRVLKDSPANQKWVTLIGGVMTSATINQYGTGYVNRYTQTSVGVSTRNQVAFYSSETCGYVNGELITTNCVTDYAQSDLKHIIDNWADNTFDDGALKEVDGYKARLITKEETNQFGCTASAWSCNGIVYSGITNFSWMMTPRDTTHMWAVGDNGTNNHGHEQGVYGLFQLKPVINVYKSAITKVNSN